MLRPILGRMGRQTSSVSRSKPKQFPPVVLDVKDLKGTTSSPDSGTGIRILDPVKPLQRQSERFDPSKAPLSVPIGPQAPDIGEADRPTGDYSPYIPIAPQQPIIDPIKEEASSLIKNRQSLVDAFTQIGVTNKRNQIKQDIEALKKKKL